jgi:hypothetical protein
VGGGLTGLVGMGAEAAIEGAGVSLTAGLAETALSLNELASLFELASGFGQLASLAAGGDDAAGWFSMLTGLASAGLFADVTTAIEDALEAGFITPGAERPGESWMDVRFTKEQWNKWTLGRDSGAKYAGSAHEIAWTEANRLVEEVFYKKK